MDTLYDYIFAPDMGIYPDTSEDLSEKLIALLNISTQQKKRHLFPRRRLPFLAGYPAQIV